MLSNRLGFATTGRAAVWDMVSVCLASLIPILVAAAFHRWLGFRSDYLGHYLAGIGGTIGLIGLALALLPERSLQTTVPWTILAVTILAIGIGGLTEATIFRLAKCDEVDFLNQSLGAALVGLAVLAAFKPNRRWGVVSVCLLAAVVALAGGFYYAFR